MLYNGIEIAEWKLLFVVIFTNVFLLAALIIVIASYFIMREKRNKKEESRIKKLRELAQNDAVAAKQLRKMERKKKNRRNRDIELRTETIIADIAIIILFIISIFYITIPAWTDYTIKDYVVYEGEFEVFRTQKRGRIRLEDGTVLSGSAGFEYGEHEGTLVYARRSNVVLGGE